MNNLSYKGEVDLLEIEHVGEHIFMWMILHEDSVWHNGNRQLWNVLHVVDK